MGTTMCALAEERLREARQAQVEAAKLREQASEIERKWRESVKGEDEAEGARRRARLRADGEMVERRIAGLIRRQGELSQEARSIDDDHQALLMRYQRKSDELATAGDDAARAEIETELADLLVQRYLYERDPKLLERANTIRAQILERAGEMFIRESWVMTPQGKIVPESKLAEHGGVGTTFCGRGSRVPIEWARRHGIAD